MAELISQIQEVITWIFGLFGTVFSFITDHPVTLFPIGLSLILGVVAVIFRIKGGLGLRSRRR